MIDATELTDLRLSSDGKRLRLRVRDHSGQPVSFSLPTCWLNAMLNALPRDHSTHSDTVHRLDSWSMERLGSSEDLVLTLRTAEGQTTSFILKLWHVQGMATIATYGNRGVSDRTLH